MKMRLYVLIALLFSVRTAAVSRHDWDLRPGWLPFCVVVGLLWPIDVIIWMKGKYHGR